MQTKYADREKRLARLITKPDSPLRKTTKRLRTTCVVDSPVYTLHVECQTPSQSVPQPSLGLRFSDQSEKGRSITLRQNP